MVSEMCTTEARALILFGTNDTNESCESCELTHTRS